MMSSLLKTYARRAATLAGLAAFLAGAGQARPNNGDLFTKNWRFLLGDAAGAQAVQFNDSKWRTLDLPHDWSIEGAFSKDHPATPDGGALPGGIGWYRKTFRLQEKDCNKLISVEFDGVYRNGEVWINGQYLGMRPYGYSSFNVDLTPFVKFGKENNVIAVKADNSKQMNSRWYSGSGIYRNVWLVKTEKIHVDRWGTCITTPEVSAASATVAIKTRIRNASLQPQTITVRTVVVNAKGAIVASAKPESIHLTDSLFELSQRVVVMNPVLWSIEKPTLYRTVTKVEWNGKVSDEYETKFGIRSFAFDREKGFTLNGKPVKINGVCNHHDLGCLGAAVNTRALERQLEIMKAMGVNGIRTSHNPPAPELLDLCDSMGFIVMDEAFDVWKMKKTEFDYALNWDEWHRRDLEDMVVRDRNHPSVFIWSIGNEVVEQRDTKDSIGTVIARELCSIIRALDSTRPITANLNHADPKNPVILSEALDLIGFSYNHTKYGDFLKDYPGKKLIASETVSSFATRGFYTQPSDRMNVWPDQFDSAFCKGNPGNTCSAYDNTRSPWGSTQETTLKLMKKYDFIAGQYIWTGFDYLGEPTPYSWPSRSSYFGLVDLAGFPKDVFYLYQSEWTTKPVLHIFPHWNWKRGDTVDVWAYTNCDSVELFLNGTSVGTKKKTGDELHLMWRLPYAPGTLKAIGRTHGKIVLRQEVKTAGAPARIVLEADRKQIAADGRDLSFVTVRVLDKDGTVVPNADNLIRFNIAGAASIAGVDNGLQTSLEPFKAEQHKAFNGLCLAVLKSDGRKGKITLVAISAGLERATIALDAK